MSDNLQSEAELQLHQRLLAGDKTAPSDIANTFIDRLIKHLTIRYKQFDPNKLWGSATIKDRIYEAATSALMDYIENPHKYNPKLRGLYGYLQMAAEGDFKNALAKQKRHDSRLKVVSKDVELLNLAGNIDIENESIARQEVRDRVVEFNRKQALQNGSVADDELDRKLLALMDIGERRTSEYAKVLNITHFPIAEQKRIVKQHKDRLNLRRKRNNLASSSGKPKIRKRKNE